MGALSALVGLLALACSAQGCDDKKRGAAAPSQSTDSPSAAFQRDYERVMRAPGSPFSAVHAQYLEPGQRLGLGLTDDGALELDGAHATLVFVMGQAFECQTGCPADVRVIREARTLAIPGSSRFSVAASEQSGKGRVLVHDSQLLATESPLTRWFPVDPALVIGARFERREPRTAASLTTNRGLLKTLYVAGILRFTLPESGEHTLTVYGYADKESQGEPLLIPFTDQTTGRESYGAGRYIEPVNQPGQGTMELDFNRATNPYCAYSPHYNCPIPPRDNRLPVAIRAGELGHAEH